MKKAFGFGVAATMVIGGAASADVLYHNPPGGFGTAVNQEFPDFPTYSTYLVADFNVPNPGFTLTSVAAPMTVNGAWVAVTTARLVLFPKVGALPDNITDDPTTALIVPVSYDGFTGVLSTVGLNLDVAAGDYWIGLTGIADSGVVGQAFALEGANEAGLPDAARNPGGSFNFPAGTDWFSIQSFDGWLWHSFALTVEGDPIPPSDLIWFTDQADFEAFNAGEGKVLRGIEDYEEAVLNPGQGVGVDDPLVSNIPNPPVFPNGLTGLPNLQVQSNLSGGNPTDPNPRGANGLGAFGAPGGNFVSDVVIANFFVDSLDLIFLTDDKTGVGGNTLHFNNSGTIEMRVYDINNNFLGMMPAPADPAGTNFLGVWSPIPIGRINVFSPQGGAEGLDNIQAWQEGNPCPADLVVNGAVDVKDLLFMLGAWGPCPKQGDCPADFDNSGEVDVKDLLFLLGAWGPCPGGNVCEGQVCGEFVQCGFGEPFDCFCWTLADGTGICLQNFLCADVEPCIDGDCPDGFVCVFQSCCGDAFCVPIIKCDDGAAAGGDTKGSGPTGSGQFIEASQSAPTRPQNVGTVPRIRR